MTKLGRSHHLQATTVYQYLQLYQTQTFIHNKQRFQIINDMINPKVEDQSMDLSNYKSVNQSQFYQASDCTNCITLPKVKCAFHPQQSITNFCTCESCLLPLCPSCVKIHTIEHVNMKKINPQYEPITDLLEQIYGEVEQLLNSSNENYKKIVEIDSRVNSFRSTIQSKISNVKQNILNEVERYFAKLDEQIQYKIQKMNYIQMLSDYKDQTKKAIIGLKNIEKCFNPEYQKIMRVVIKYKGGNIKNQILNFQSNLSDFLKQVNNNFVTFSVREDYKQILHTYLESIKKIQISDVKINDSVPNIFNKLTEVYEKTSVENKKEIRRSIGTFLANSASKQKNFNQQNSILKQSYNSVSNYISKNASEHCITATPLKQDVHSHNRRSLSKGKGLSLMQINSTVNTSSLGQVKGARAVNICSPVQFNRTTIIRRQK